MEAIHNISLYSKAVEYDEITHDYAMYLDGEYVGSRASEYEAVQALDQQAYFLLSHS